MNSSALHDQISSLVDRLREGHSGDVTLSDVASATEVLIATTQRYFSGLDTSIYREFRNLASYIENAKLEIGKLRPEELKGSRLPLAGRQLDAVVKATEVATETIMDAAEAIMNADRADEERYAGTVSDACMRIIEACSFQDITGQRITKVVETLQYIEDRLEEIENSWGTVAPPPLDEDEPAAPAAGHTTLIGPQYEGEGMDQSDVDTLMDETTCDRAPASDDGAIVAERKGGAQAEVDALFD